MSDGGFDLSHVKLDRTGKINTPKLHSDLSEWNKTVGKLNELIKENNLYNDIRYLSPYYRVSPYCIEGERGMISKKIASWESLMATGEQMGIPGVRIIRNTSSSFKE